MDRDEEVGRQAIGDHRPLEQPDRRRLGSDEQHGLVEAGIDQRLLDLLRQLQVEGIFRHAAGAQRARYSEGVADIDDDAEGRGLAVRMCRRGVGGRRLLLAASRTRMSRREQGRKRNEQSGSGVPRVRHVARLSGLVDSAKTDYCPITSFAALVHVGTYTCARRAAVVPNKTCHTKQDLHRVKRSAWANSSVFASLCSCSRSVF